MSVKAYQGPSGVLKAHSNWLGVSDLPADRDVELQIETAVQITDEPMLEGKKHSGGGLQFRGKKKAWVLNSGNRRVLDRRFGTDTAGWMGKTIKLYVDPTVMAFGVNTGGIKIRDEASEKHNAKANELVGGGEPATTPDEGYNVCGKMCGEGDEPEDCMLDPNHEGDCSPDRPML